jgi:hypothetical protein
MLGAYADLGRSSRQKRRVVTERMTSHLTTGTSIKYTAVQNFSAIHLSHITVGHFIPNPSTIVQVATKMGKVELIYVRLLPVG